MRKIAIRNYIVIFSGRDELRLFSQAASILYPILSFRTSGKKGNTPRGGGISLYIITERQNDQLTVLPLGDFSSRENGRNSYTYSLNCSELKLRSMDVQVSTDWCHPHRTWALLRRNELNNYTCGRRSSACPSFLNPFLSPKTKTMYFWLLGFLWPYIGDYKSCTHLQEC